MRKSASSVSDRPFGTDLRPEVDGDPPLSAVDLLKILRRRRALILLTIFVVAAMGSILAMSLPRLYRAEALLIFDPRKQRVTDFPDVISSLPSESTAFQAAFQSQLDVLSSRPIAQIVVDHLHLVSNPEFASPAWWAWVTAAENASEHAFSRTERALGLADGTSTELTQEQQTQQANARVVNAYLKWLVVDNDGRSLTMKLSMATKNPDLAAAIVNAHAEAYLREERNEKLKATRTANAWLTARVGELKAQLHTLEDEIEAYRRTHQFVVGGQGMTVAGQQLAELTSKLVDARTDRDEAQARLSQAMAVEEGAAKPDTISEVLDSKTIQDLRAREADLAQKEAEFALHYGRRLMERIVAGLAKTRSEIRGEIQKISAALRRKAEAADYRVRALQVAVDEAADLNVAQVKLQEMERNADATRALLQNFLARAQETSGGLANTSDVRLISAAVPPLRPYFPNRMIWISASWLVGLAAAAFLTTLVELLDKGFRTAEQIENACGIPGLGLVPELSRRTLKGRLPSECIATQPSGVFSSGIQVVATLLRPATRDGNKVFLVTSSVPEEGKTVLAASLALDAAISGRRALLIDADYRRAAITAALGARPRPDGACCFSDDSLLAGICRSPTSGLDYVPASRGVERPLDTFESLAFDEMLLRARQNYDMVFIDSPPVLAVGDALALARKVDAVILAVRWGKTPRSVVLGALKVIDSAGGVVAGTVMSRVNIRRHALYVYGDSGYHFGRYHHYYNCPV